MPGSLLLRCISWSLLLDLSIHGQVAPPAVIGVPKRVEHLHPDITDRFGIQGKAVFVSGLVDFYVFPGVCRNRPAGGLDDLAVHYFDPAVITSIGVQVVTPPHFEKGGGSPDGQAVGYCHCSPLVNAKTPQIGLTTH